MRMRLELIFVGFGNVARRAVTLLEEIGVRLHFDTRTVAIVTGRHGAAWSERGLDVRGAAHIIQSGGCLEEWPAALPAPSRSNTAAIIAALAARHAAAAHQGRLVCIESTVLDARAGEPATSHVRAALDSGAHVVTANKGPVAFAYAELAARAALAGRLFLFEGTVMDGIPVFNLLRETLPGVRVARFRGVLNSTTHHILVRLESGESFDSALEKMQADGIAEADSALDLDGWDAAAKTAALMNVLMQAQVTPHDIERAGIRGVTADDVRAAVRAGTRLRLVASAERQGGTPAGRVRLERVPAADPLAALQADQNALLLDTDVLGEIGLAQRSSGLTQTAYAVVTDLAAVARSRIQSPESRIM